MTRVLCRPLKNDVEIYRGIAQSGSALALGARCREFKSLYPDQFRWFTQCGSLVRIHATF